MDDIYNDQDKLLLTDISQMFDGERGDRVMTMLASLTGAKVSLDPEDLHAADSGKPVPLDPVGLAKRHGMRCVFWKLQAMKSEGDRLRKETK